jgi:hypothetical protein
MSTRVSRVVILLAIAIGLPAVAATSHAADGESQSLSPPYPPSPVITEVIWAPKESIVRQAAGGDNWPITWGDDDVLYTAFGDGWGFEPLLPNKLSMGFSKVAGMPPDHKGFNFTAVNGEFRGAGHRGRKASGLLMVDGVLYVLARNLGNAQLAWSRDDGATWTWADWKFTTSFGAPTFLNFGKNYAGARDEYVYIYSLDGGSAYIAADRMVLARVPRNQIAKNTAYEYFVGLDATGQPVWSRDIAQRGAVFEHPKRCYRSGVTYNAGLKRYLWCQSYPESKHPQGPRFQGGFGIYDAPEPWGPWTTAFHTDDWDVGPGESSSIPTKWMSDDGRTVHLVFSGDDHFSVRRATFRLSPTAAVHQSSATLTVTEEPGVIIVRSSGAEAQVGIPTWKAVLRRNDGGNISALHVPADHPIQLSSRTTGQWPLTVLMSKNDQGVKGTMSKGRENYASFPVETFQLVEQTPRRVVVRIAGPSKNKHFEQERTYTFTPDGIAIDASMLPLIDLRSVAFDPHWNRTQLADSHQGAVPMRTQGRVGWVPMPSSGRDGVTPLPQGVDFPLEIELRLRRPEPTFVRVFYDQVFEAYAGKRVLIHNNKDFFDSRRNVMLYEKLTGISAGPVARGARQTFKMHFTFETQKWE